MLRALVVGILFCFDCWRLVQFPASVQTPGKVYRQLNKPYNIALLNYYLWMLKRHPQHPKRPQTMLSKPPF